MSIRCPQCDSREASHMAFSRVCHNGHETHADGTPIVGGFKVITGKADDPLVSGDGTLYGYAIQASAGIAANITDGSGTVLATATATGPSGSPDVTWLNVVGDTPTGSAFTGGITAETPGSSAPRTSNITLYTDAN